MKRYGSGQESGECSEKYVRGIKYYYIAKMKITANLPVSKRCNSTSGLSNIEYRESYISHWLGVEYCYMVESAY
jgi:hypothetical protein